MIIEIIMVEWDPGLEVSSFGHGGLFREFESQVSREYEILNLKKR